MSGTASVGGGKCQGWRVLGALSLGGGKSGGIKFWGIEFQGVKFRGASSFGSSSCAVVAACSGIIFDPINVPILTVAQALYGQRFSLPHLESG